MTARDQHKKLQQILQELPTDTYLIGETYLLASSILSKSKSLEDSFIAICITEVNKQKCFAVINTQGKMQKISYSKCIAPQSDCYQINKKLKACGNKFLKSVVKKFRNSDQICEKTWKKVPIGLEKVIFTENRSLLDLANIFQNSLSEYEKRTILCDDYLPYVLRKKWLNFIVEAKPLVTHK